MGHFNQMKTIIIPIATDGTAKDAGDVVGGLLSAKIATPQNGFTLRSLKLVDDDNQAAALTVYIFDAAPTAIIDDAAFSSAFLIGDHQKLIRSIPIAATTDYTVLNSNASAIKADLNIDVYSLDGNIYLYIVCTATPTYTASGLTLYLYGWED